MKVIRKLFAVIPNFYIFAHPLIGWFERINLDRMYAIVNIAGQQFKVEKDQKLFVHRLEEKEGEPVRFEDVLLIDNDKNVVVGEPTIKGAAITGKVVSHIKGDKVQVFKKKRRKGYKVLRGHRQQLTEIHIEEILEKGAEKAAGKKTTAKTAPKAADTGKATAEPVAREKAGTDIKKKTAAPKKKTGTSAEGKKPAGTAAKTSVKKAASPGKATAKPSAKKSSGTTGKAAPKKPATGGKDKK